jgi:LysR family transcriptional regulator, hydrogen peroxide-inducible genes activator
MPADTPHLPTVRQIRYFVALAEERHFGRAAARCFVSQSAFSVAIQELESLLDATLVDRTNRSVTITAKGKEVATLAKLCLRDLQTLAETARGGSGPLTGSLRLGVIPTIAPFLLPRVLPELRAAYPELKLYLYEDITQQLHEQLLEGSIDLMVLALPYALSGVDVRPLFKDRFRLAVREGTTLVDPENYRFNRLHAGNVLLLREGHCLREHAIEACKIRDSQKLSPFSASSLLTLIEMVDADLGVSFLPEMAVGSALLASTKVKTYPLAAGSYRTIGLAWRRGSARGDEFAMLGDFLTEASKRSRHRKAGPASKT